ncbi:unnamed protein product [Notodromas monacha]|uniref:Transcriptional regulator ATRX n=1 Tax=Notodromas monacha TaxID=399045 RepID=A0A7R9BND8_9CRUS|nr:unnamed protein product [Notodromas monacha]CAG0917341.1 unnamed protein product [Notodromas monacha]
MCLDNFGTVARFSVKEVMDSDSLLVDFFDFGDSDVRKVSDCRLLPMKLAKVPVRLIKFWLDCCGSSLRKATGEYISSFCDGRGAVVIKTFPPCFQQLTPTFLPEFNVEILPTERYAFDTRTQTQGASCRSNLCLLKMIDEASFSFVSECRHLADRAEKSSSDILRAATKLRDAADDIHRAPFEISHKNCRDAVEDLLSFLRLAIESEYREIIRNGETVAEKLLRNRDGASLSKTSLAGVEADTSYPLKKFLSEAPIHRAVAERRNSPGPLKRCGSSDSTATSKRLGGYNTPDDSEPQVQQSQVTTEEPDSNPTETLIAQARKPEEGVRVAPTENFFEKVCMLLGSESESSEEEAKDDSCDNRFPLNGIVSVNEVSKDLSLNAGLKSGLETEDIKSGLETEDGVATDENVAAEEVVKTERVSYEPFIKKEENFSHEKDVDGLKEVQIKLEPIVVKKEFDDENQLSQTSSWLSALNPTLRFPNTEDDVASQTESPLLHPRIILPRYDPVQIMKERLPDCTVVLNRLPHKIESFLETNWSIASADFLCRTSNEQVKEEWERLLRPVLGPKRPMRRDSGSESSDQRPKRKRVARNLSSMLSSGESSSSSVKSADSDDAGNSDDASYPAITSTSQHLVSESDSEESVKTLDMSISSPPSLKGHSKTNHTVLISESSRDSSAASSRKCSPEGERDSNENLKSVNALISGVRLGSSDFEDEESRGDRKEPKEIRKKALKELLHRRSSKKNTRRTFRISSSSDSSEDESKSNGAKSETDSESDYESSETSDSDDLLQSRKARQMPKKRNRLQISSESDDDLQIIDELPAGSSQHSSPGRRNIKKVMSSKQLGRDTQTVMREEKERALRLAEKQKNLENLGAKVAEPESPLYLDIDKETKLPTVSVNEKLAKLLKPHQREGVTFMFNSAVESVERIRSGDVGGGAILAHCMGLGKTLQVIALIHTLATHSSLKMKKFLVLCPKNTVINWQNEFRMWLRKTRLQDDVIVHAFPEKQCSMENRVHNIRTWYRSKGVFIMGYPAFRTLGNPVDKAAKNFADVLQEALIAPGPDMVVCDEGHLLKNEKSALFKALQPMKTRRKIILTGTPLQNNLNEYHTMVQIVKPNLLGTKQQFSNRFVNPIQNGSHMDSSAVDVHLMKRRSFVLHRKLEKIIQRLPYTVLKPYLPEKLEYVIKIKLSPLQRQLYVAFLNQIALEGGIGGKGTGSRQRLLQDFHVFARVWTHPVLLQMQESRYNQRQADAKAKKTKSIKAAGNENGLESDDDFEAVIANSNWWKATAEDTELESFEHSGKVNVFLDILLQCQMKKEKLIVFSSSLLVLDFVEDVLSRVDRMGRNDAKTRSFDGNVRKVWDENLGALRHWQKNRDYARIDGTTISEDRARAIDKFNRSDNSLRLMLVSTKAGGIGVNMVGANRAILFDVNWNPANDVQALYRIYRLGQTKPVYVYRLVATGCMEERIYARCIAKLSLSSRVIDEHQITRHFLSADLQALYKLDELIAEKSRPLPALPSDPVLADLLVNRTNWVAGYEDFDSLLENRIEEELGEDEKRAAWEEYDRVQQMEESKAQAFNSLVNVPYMSTPDGAADFLRRILLNPNVVIPGVDWVLREALSSATQSIMRVPQQMGCIQFGQFEAFTPWYSLIAKTCTMFSLTAMSVTNNIWPGPLSSDVACLALKKFCVNPTMDRNVMHAVVSVAHSDISLDLNDESDPRPSIEDETVSISAKAPPESTWYHGRLNRTVAEERLNKARQKGSYLVRESDRKPGSYVLSYLGQNGINHFKVTCVCGTFFIGGRPFDSLSDVVAFYTHASNLLTNERLTTPVEPPEPVNDLRKVVAILPYSKMPDSDELSFQKGDIFFVHNDMGEGWMWVTAHRTGEQGMIFQELVEDLDDTFDPNTVYPWFHPTVTKQEAVDLLVEAGPGSFLVRPSDNSPGDYSLFFHINSQIQRFRIQKKGVRYLMGGRTFDCLDAVINRYKHEYIVLGHTLGMPVTKQDGDVNSFESKSVEHAEKIYATLRECREQCGLQLKKAIKMQGWLNKRSEKTKKWKCLYFVLQKVEGGEMRLYYYENPKRMKPKGIIDLSFSHLYQVVERELPCMATVTYLNAATADSVQDWMCAMRPHCVAQNMRAPKIDNLKVLRCIQIAVLEARHLPVKLVPSPYCTISVNQVKCCKTRGKCGSEPVWEEDFLLDDIPPDVQTVTVTVWNKGRRSKDAEIAEVTLELQNLKSGEEDEQWHQLMGVTPVSEWGQLRLRVRYLHDLVMPREEYSALLELLLDADLVAVQSLADVCHSDRTPLAAALLRVFVHERQEAHLLQVLCEAEIEREEETSTLFRASMCRITFPVDSNGNPFNRSATLTTSLMDSFMRIVSHPFLESALASTLKKMVESKQSCELNPMKLESQSEACANAEFLLQTLDELTDAIFFSCGTYGFGSFDTFLTFKSSVPQPPAPETCPMTIRYVFGCLQRSVSAKWPHERLVRTRVISGFIFLRLLCPAILNPRQFNLLVDSPPPQAARSLIMIAKCLQNLANLVEFGGKESYMEVVNPFILKNKERMIYFLDKLSNVKEKPPSEDILLKHDPARDLATLHHICDHHLKDFISMSRTKPALKRLVTVTEMLTKHKRKYMEIIG